MKARNIRSPEASAKEHHAASCSVAIAPGRQGLWLLLAVWLLCFAGPQAAFAAEYRLVTLTDDLRWPWSVARLPDGDFLVTEREGRLILLSATGERRVLAGTPGTLFAGQGGYFDVVLHPAFEENRLIYLSYAEGSETANGTAVFRARFENGQLDDGRRIMRVAPDKETPQHYGGRMLFLPDNTLLLTSGEGFEHREQAQSMSSELGKVLRINDEGGAEGMLSRDGEERLRIWTLGHRNPQGITRDPASGRIYLHEHGPRGGDELNLLEESNNYGWPAVTHGVDYSGAYVSPFKSAPGMTDPLYTWVPSIAPSGLAWYAGNAFPEWKNSLFLGALVDKEVRRLELIDREVVLEETLFSELDSRIRDLHVYEDAIYILTDGEQGSLIEVKPR